MDARYARIIAVIAIGTLTIGSFSVMGLLQSTEEIGASGIIIRPVIDPIETLPEPDYSLSPPPPEPNVEIDIYSDPECQFLMSNVEWGEIEAGDNSHIQIYIKNNGETSVIISLESENWSSETAQENMDLSWDYNGSPISTGDVLPVTLTLNVNDDCPEFDSFGFDIIIIGS
jgi:hypothetical protein